MNTKSLLTRIGVPVLSLGLLGGLGASLATSASASVRSDSFTVVTHSALHRDTTSIPGGITAIDPSTGQPGGTVWAYDNLSERFTVTPLGDNKYDVQLTSSGSFSAFADPTTGLSASFSGSTNTTYDLGTVTGTPDPSALPAQMPDGSGISAAIHALFGSGATFPGGSYDFQYRAAQFKADDGYTAPGITVSGTLYEQVG